MDSILRQYNPTPFARNFVLVIILILSFCVSLGLQSDFSFTEFSAHSSQFLDRIFSLVYFRAPIVLAVYGLKKQVHVIVRLVTVSKEFNAGFEVPASFVLVSCLTYSSTPRGSVVG
jgi:hypothetical protein